LLVVEDNQIIKKHLGVRYPCDKKDECFSPVVPTKKHDECLITSIDDLPAELIVSLKDATEFGDAAKIDEVIEKIRTVNDRLGEAFSALAENFAYDELLALADGLRSI
jgi:hypothetical protein